MILTDVVSIVLSYDIETDVVSIVLSYGINRCCLYSVILWY